MESVSVYVSMDVLVVEPLEVKVPSAKSVESTVPSCVPKPLGALAVWYINGEPPFAVGMDAVFSLR